ADRRRRGRRGELDHHGGRPRRSRADRVHRNQRRSHRAAVKPRKMNVIWRWLALLVAIAVSAWIVARAPIATDIAAFLPGPATPEQRLLAEQLRDGIAARLILVGVTVPDAAQSANAAKVASALTRRLRTDSHFTFVVSGDPKDFERERDLLFNARYL